MCQIVKSCDVFADDVKLDVHYGALFDGVEVGVVVGVGNDADLEGVFRWPTNRKTDAIDVLLSGDERERDGGSPADFPFLCIGQADPGPGETEKHAGRE